MKTVSGIPFTISALDGSDWSVSRPGRALLYTVPSMICRLFAARKSPIPATLSFFQGRNCRRLLSKSYIYFYCQLLLHTFLS
jgi:hypothetical protein